MKSVLPIIIKEFKNNWQLYLLGAALLSTIFSAAFFISIASENIIGGFYDNANYMSKEDGGFIIHLNGLHYSSIDSVSDLPFKEVYPLADRNADSDEFSYNGAALEGNYIDAMYFRENTDIKIISGIEFSPELNNSNYTWLSEETARQLNCRLGDLIESKYGNYEIAGIFKEKAETRDIIIPFETYYNSKTERGEFVPHTICGVLEDSREVKPMYAKLKKLGIMPTCGLDDMLDFLALASVLFRVIFLITLAAGLWAFSNVCGVILNNRFEFIMRMRVLGMRTRAISGIYVALMFAMMALSFGIVSILGNFFIAHVKNVTREIYSGIEIDGGQNMRRLLIAGAALCVLLIVKTYFEIGRKVGKADFISVLEEKV